MDHRERIMAVFRGEEPDKVPWMPRLEHWYNVNKELGALPEEYRGLDLIDVYRDLDASRRHYISPLKISYKGNVEIVVREEGGHVLVTYKTPVGALSRRDKRAEYGMSSRIVEHLVKDLRDLRVLEFILENMEVEFDAEAFKRFEAELMGQGMVWYNFPRIPLQRLFIDYMGFQRTIAFLRRHPLEMESIIEVIEETDGKFYDVIGSSPFEVVNFGDNIDSRLVSPALFKKYHLPYYQRRVEELHRKGKFVICHVDGYAKPLLPFFKEAGWDGVEALTVKPTGDITLDEAKEALGDEMILIDGIPFHHFLPNVGYGEFEGFVRKVIRTFSNNLILGISDEMPPPGEVWKLRLVTKIIEGEKGGR